VRRKPILGESRMRAYEDFLAKTSHVHTAGSDSVENQARRFSYKTSAVAPRIGFAATGRMTREAAQLRPAVSDLASNRAQHLRQDSRDMVRCQCPRLSVANYENIHSAKAREVVFYVTMLLLPRSTLVLSSCPQKTLIHHDILLGKA
jgi:hypothetical protein